ncbi:membrane protein [Sphingobium quisquiliarum P25]|uniref:Membrane protein n=2 Tax=Sphingobium quisquiliarum TaxID=538379 RepID=T0IFI9_9SPHN|nr:membrane protein [Sphingobium quisquiliarum P25]EZP70438.1 Membrane protein [Sphingomonas paucimobilis]
MMIKKLLMSLAATTMVASPMLAAQAQAAPHREVTRVVKQGPHGRTVYKQKTVVRKNDHRRWAKGQRFDRRYARDYRVINDYRAYRLSSPPRGYHWVRSGNDAVLVAIAGGIIGAVIGNVIR